MPTKVHIVKAMAFSVVMYGCESWTIKKAEHQRIYAFELWCWRRLFRAPWTARISNQSILNEINLEYLLEGLRLKLKLQYFSLLMRRADSLEKTLMLGKIEGRRDNRGWDGWMASLWRTGKPGVLQCMGSQRVRHDWATEQQGVMWQTTQPFSLFWLQGFKERQWIQNLNFILNQTVVWKKDPGCIQGLVPSHIFTEPKVCLRQVKKKKKKKWGSWLERDARKLSFTW